MAAVGSSRIKYIIYANRLKLTASVHGSYAMEEQLIPIDIHKNKLIEWLISRRHCNREWQEKIIVIREKINNAIQDMPVHAGIAELLSGSYINYFHCKKIVEILRETEKDTKNIFGMYGSQRMKDWQEIVKLYEKENVYLIEAAQMLIRNINYEVPSLKKQLTKFELIQLECEKRDSDYTKNANAIQSEFNSQCKQLGIEGIKIKRELVACLAGLPKILNEVSRKAKSLKAAQEFYEAFVKFIIGQEHLGGCLPLLKYIIEHGNVTTYEWMYGEPPLKIEEPMLDIKFDDEDKLEENYEKVDFGEESIDFSVVDESVLKTDDQIDFVEGGIDWGNVDEAIDWSTVDDGSKIDLSDVTLNESGIVVEETGMSGGVARDKEAFSILDNPETRYKLMDELLELESFLRIRLLEMAASDTEHLIGLSQMSEAPPLIQMQTTKSTSAMLKQTQDVLAALMEKRACQLHSIKHSPRYVDQLTFSLKQKLSIMDKMQLSKKALQSKKDEARNGAIDIQPKIKLIIDKTKELQKEIELDISKKYKNRPVNIMGGASTL